MQLLSLRANSIIESASISPPKIFRRCWCDRRFSRGWCESRRCVTDQQLKRMQFSLSKIIRQPQRKCSDQ
jgi:hypothetical protein